MEIFFEDLKKTFRRYLTIRVLGPPLLTNDLLKFKALSNKNLKNDTLVIERIRFDSSLD